MGQIVSPWTGERHRQLCWTGGVWRVAVDLGWPFGATEQRSGKLAKLARGPESYPTWKPTAAMLPTLLATWSHDCLPNVPGLRVS